MAFFATLGLLFVLVIRPQEIWPVLEALRLLDVFTGLAAIGVLIEFSRGEPPNRFSPQLPFLGAFVLWCYVSGAALMGREALVLATGLLQGIFMMVFLYGGANFQRLRGVLVLLLCLAGFVTIVAVHQGMQEPSCMEKVPDPSNPGALMLDPETADGRWCNSTRICEQDHWERDWGCERPGLFGTMSAGTRVRYRGQLGDPNELSVFIAAVMPMLFGVGISLKRKVLSGFALLMVGLGLYAVILTQSRGGQLVVGCVFAVYFVSRFGLKGLLGAAVFALPVVLLGGRDSGEADESAQERTQLLYDGILLFMQHPIVGVGKDMFKDHMDLHLTAHNSYLLAAAELGFPGFVFWTGLYWTSLKIPLTILRSKSTMIAPDVRQVALALTGSFIGMAVGIFFLSFTYKQLLFVWFGLAGALYLIAKREDPSLEVKIGAKDIVGIIIFDILILGFIYGYARGKV